MQVAVGASSSKVLILSRLMKLKAFTYLTLSELPELNLGAEMSSLKKSSEKAGAEYVNPLFPVSMAFSGI